MELFFGHDLNIEQSQKLTLTPEMIQSLNILQYSMNDLIEYVSDAMNENPAIEMDNGDIFLQEYSSDDDFRDDRNSDGVMAYDEVEPDDWDANDWYDFAENMNSYSSDYYNDYSQDFNAPYTDAGEYNVLNDLTLEENLMQQLEVCKAKYMVRAIAAYIIQLMDENGYLTATPEEIRTELNVSEQDVKEALNLIHTFDPVGVGAVDLAECLSLQLEAIGKMNGDIKKILDSHLEDIGMNRIREVARATGIRAEKVQEYADLLRSLDPKPGRMFEPVESTKFIIPDVIVENHDGDISVSINENAVPRISVRREYNQMLRESKKNSTVSTFLNHHVNSAKWLARSIEQRCQTILNVSRLIVEAQKEFFFKGASALKPLTMKEIATRAGVNESTVSRAVNGKYLQSARGVFELKYFFSGAGRFSGANGDSASSEALKTMIKGLVDSENRMTPLSDRSIAEAIMVTGVEISRRTVTKYREELGIPSSTMRRRVK